VDPGILTFLNHGCNGTYNYGANFSFHEFTPGMVNGPKSFFESNRIYDPRSDRIFPNWELTRDILLRDVKAGQEILDNYLTYGGRGYFLDRELNLKELRDICTDQGLGIIQKYEEEQS